MTGRSLNIRQMRTIVTTILLGIGTVPFGNFIRTASAADDAASNSFFGVIAHGYTLGLLSLIVLVAFIIIGIAFALKRKS